MCNLNNSIKREAQKHGIDWRLWELHAEYHKENGKRKPRDLVDLLEVVL